MILPTKGIAPDRALLAVGGNLLRLLDEPQTISRIWEVVSRDRTGTRETISFDWFVLALDFLFAAKAIELIKGRIHRATRITVAEAQIKEPTA